MKEEEKMNTFTSIALIVSLLLFSPVSFAAEEQSGETAEQSHQTVEAQQEKADEQAEVPLQGVDAEGDVRREPTAEAEQGNVQEGSGVQDPQQSAPTE